MEAKKTKADLLFVYAAYSLRYLYLLILIPFYARVLGPEGYGVVLASLSLMQMLWLFVNWGFSIDGTREIATAKPEAYAGIFGKQFSGRLILSAVAVVLGGIAIYFSSVLSVHFWTASFAIMLGIISAFNLGWYFTGTHRPRLAVKLEVLGFVLNLILILSLVREQSDSFFAIASVLISGLLTLILAHWWIKDEIKPFNIDMSKGLQLTANTKSIFIYSSSAVLLGASSTYLLSTLSTSVEVGYFGSAERLISAGISMMAPLGAIFIPKVTVLFEENVALANQYIRKILFGLVSIGVLGLLISVFGSTLMVGLIFGDGFEGSVTVLSTLGLIFPFYACTLVLSAYVLIPLHHDQVLAKIILFGAFVNILLGIIFGAQLGAYGMALARVVSEVIVFIGLLLTCYRLGLLQPILSPHKYPQGEVL